MPDGFSTGGAGLDLLTLLEFAVFERDAPGVFGMVCRAPEWLAGLLPHSPSVVATAELTEVFPYLEVFLPDAEAIWSGDSAARLHSEIWTQPDASGTPRRLRAAAIRVEGRNLLLIEPAESLYAETQSFVQRAHDSALAYDKIARLSRDLAIANEQLEQRNREVEHAAKEKSEFLARMSHEIRTPLNAILGMADLLWETPLDAAQREYVRIFRRAGDNLLNLINDILDLSKAESGQMELERTGFDLAEVLEKACEIIAVPAHAKGLELSCRISPEVPTLLIGDPGRLRQVLLNLLGNAVKFTVRGEVSLTVEPDPGNSAAGVLRFTVRDTGIGIPPGRLESIFESFSQVDSSITRRFGGTGLGLAISKQFVELMGGRIWVESAPDKGSAFRFTVPFGVRGSAAPPPGFAGLACLVIGDSSSHRAAVRDLLTGWGAAVAESDGTDAPERLRAGGPYSLVLVDGRIPGIDSYRLAGQLRAAAGDATKVLIMLTTDHGADAARCRGLGLVPLLKPVRRSDLLEAWCGGVAAAGGESETAPEAERGPLRILLADDSEENRLLVRSYLKDSNCELDEAADGAAAVAKFQSTAYQLVLIDVEMPVLDGYSATRRMRDWERQQGVRPTPIVALTAHALAEAAERSLAAGCTAHLTKPIRKSVLLEAVRRHALPAQTVPIRVVADPRLESILPGYLENRRKELPMLRSALESLDFDVLRTAGHKLKGSGGGYGFPVLTELGAAIEDAALGRDAGAIREKILELETYLGKVRVEYPPSHR